MEEDDMHTVHYVTQDAMPNFKLRVTLTRLSAARTRRAPGGGGQAAGAAAADATEAGASRDTATTAATRPAGRPEQFKVVRTFAWQEKVYSKAELVSAQRTQRQGIPASSPWRAAHFGSQAHVSTDRTLASPPEGSTLFSYVQADEWCERYETSRSVTTSAWEGRNHLARKLATDARNRQKMLNLQAMFIMADLGDETTVAGSNEKVLAVVRAHHDGSFNMTPGFSPPGQRLYHFEDDHGAIYEYALELASHGSAPSLEKRAAKLASAVSAQADEMRRQAAADRLPAPGPDANALRLLLLAELVSAAGFERDRLYLEWQLHFDPELWLLQHSEQEVVQPGLIQGVTHVSRMVRYPPDPSTDTPGVWVAHFAHPLEVEWVARAAPAPRDWPRLVLQVCTYDLWDRATTEGYGWMQLGPAAASGSSTQYVDTWKPLGSRRDQQRAFFIGGSEELADMASCGAPRDHSGRVLNRYGYLTQTSGNIKVRTHMVLQAGAAGGASPRKAAAAGGPTAAAARQRRSLSLAVVLERARSRLQEARGGEVVVREGLLVQAPVITGQPEDATVNEGSTVQLGVKAVVNQGLPPLRYQWYKDSKRLTVATSNSPLLVLVDVAAADGGSYHCMATNKDGSATSSRALVTVHRVGRLAAAGGSSSGAAASAGASPVLDASSSGGAQAALARRALATVPRTLPLGGTDYTTGLPLSTRLSSAEGGSSSGSGATAGGGLSPLIRSRPQSAAGRFPAPAGAAAAAGPEGGGAASGRLSSLITIPARRFATTRAPPPVASAGAGPGAQAAAPARPEPQPADAPGGSSTTAAGWFAAAEGSNQAASDSVQPPKPPSEQQQPSAPGSAAGSPMRRTRVSEQQ